MLVFGLRSQSFVRDAGVLADGTAGALWFVVGLLFLVGLGYGLYVAFLALRRHRRWQRALWELEQDMEGLDLTSEQRGLLLAAACRLKGQPNKVRLRRAGFLETAVHDYVQPFMSRGAGTQHLARACEVIRDLRAKLRVFGSQQSAYCSTRQIAAGVCVRVTFPNDLDSLVIWGLTGARREDFLEVKGLTGSPAKLSERQVDVACVTLRHTYSFRSRVMRADRALASCLLEHTIDLQTAGNREHHRVQVDRPIVFRAAWEGENTNREGTLIDLSAEGAAIRAQCEYEEGEGISIDLVPVELYEPYAVEELLPPRRLVATIRDVGTGQGDACVYHMAFRDMDEKTKRYVAQLVHRIDVNRRSNTW